MYSITLRIIPITHFGIFAIHFAVFQACNLAFLPVLVSSLSLLSLCCPLKHLVCLPFHQRCFLSLILPIFAFLLLFCPFLAFLSPFLFALCLSCSQVVLFVHFYIIPKCYLCLFCFFCPIFDHIFCFMALFLPLCLPWSQVCIPLLWECYKYE